MKVRGRKGRGNRSLLPSSTACLLFFLFFNYYFSPVVYPFSCREQYGLKSLIMLGIHRPEFALWQNFFRSLELHLGKISVQGLY